MKQATIFNIQKFSIHDGPGIRTVVFFKGCQLRCRWCANPESQKGTPELYQVKNKCIGCGACVSACPAGALSAEKDGIAVAREQCTACGSCAAECYAHALSMKGMRYTTDEILHRIAQDAPFYRNSGGGYTLSGGEPLLQADFCIELAQKCARAGFHGAIETCGFGDTEAFKTLVRWMDVVFFDIKHMDDAVHKAVTGVSNQLILHNLESIQADAKEVVLRTPVIPGTNDSTETITAIAAFCCGLEKVHTWELLPYHKLGEYKYESLGTDYTLKGTQPPAREVMQHLVDSANAILVPAGKQCVLNTSALG